jgi:hypothetical protein
VGKTFLVGAIIFALAIIHPGLTVIWTAHRFRTADETFESMRSMSKMKQLAGHIEKVTAGAGDQAIYFLNGSRILFGARESGFGRGFTEVDILVFDEAQILTERAIDDMIPAQNASQNALTLMIGTPPKPSDPSEVFTNRRNDALNGTTTDVVYIEFSAERDSDMDDRAAWRKANPSYPHRTSEAAMLRMRRNLSEDSFRREALGVWDEDLGGAPIPAGPWNDLARPREDVPEGWPLTAIGLDMNPERTKVTVGVAAKSETGIHLELAVDDEFSDSGSEALIEWVYSRARRRVPVVIDAYSPIRSIEAALKKKGCKVFILGPSELSQACGGLYDAVMKDKAVSHIGQEQLDRSLAGSVKQKFGDGGAWKWNRKNFDVDLTPIMAITCAHFGAVKFAKERKKRSGGSIIL